MTNLFKRLFKSKSKFLLIILCLLGLAFSYSCSCRNESTGPKWEDDDKKVDPKVFTISTNSVETRLVQKADGSGFNYQPSIKFSEANSNEYTVCASTEDATFKSKLKYDDKTGLISLSDYTDLATEKKTITITFTVKANDQSLQKPETNFTLTVDLKKTYGKLDPAKNIGELFVQASGFSPSLFGFTVQFRNAKATDVSAILKVLDDGKNKGAMEYNKNNFITSLKSNLKEQADKSSSTYKVTYKSMDLVKDEKGATGVWSFTFKFKFSDEDYELTDEQKNGVDYRLDLSPM